ncbi:MAG TPA: biotin/lipoyl-containing protein [Atribacteraceae bacterium]|nr:biotin/lipoyl-containing protein [Atribacteraceae bacterium]
MRKFLVRVNGEEYEVEVAEITPGNTPDGLRIEEVKKLSGAGKAQTPPLQVTTSVRSPMPGRVLSINVDKGDKVEVGQVLLILEAMKMENEIQAENSGVVTRILVGENETVDAGDLLLEIVESQV